ncbi:Transducin (beta)-like 3 [Mortierella sp. AD094]|nr:Transducin (beta)-like 3 [Mortierella sp. AD094]
MTGVDFGEWSMLKDENPSRTATTATDSDGSEDEDDDPIFKSVIYTPDGKLLIAATGESKILIYNTSNWSLQRTLDGHDSEPLECIKLSPDGSTLVSIGENFKMQVWDVNTGKNIFTRDDLPSDVIDMTFSAPPFRSSGQRLDKRRQRGFVAFVGGDKAVYLWDLNAKKPGLDLVGHTDSVQCVQFSSGDNKNVGESKKLPLLASAGRDTTVRLWDIESGHCLHVLEGHEEDVTAIQFLLKGTLIASGCLRGHVKTYRHDQVSFSVTEWPIFGIPRFDGAVKIWDTITNRTGLVMRGDGRGIGELVFSPNSLQFATTTVLGNDFTIRQWDTQTGTQGPVLSGHSSTILGIAYAPDGKQLASASLDGTVRLWAITEARGLTLQRGGELGRHTSNIHQVSHVTIPNHSHSTKATKIGDSTCGSRVVISMCIDTVRVWDAVTGEPGLIIRRDSNKTFDKFTVSPCGTQLTTVASEKPIQLWDLRTGQVKVELLPRPEDEGWAMAWVVYAHDQVTIATCGHSQVVQLYDRATGQHLRSLNGGEVLSILFAPPSTTSPATVLENIIVSLSEDKLVRIWNYVVGECLQIFEHEVQPDNIYFSRDYTKIITTNDEKRAILICDITDIVSTAATVTTVSRETQVLPAEGEEEKIENQKEDEEIRTLRPCAIKDAGSLTSCTTHVLFHSNHQEREGDLIIWNLETNTPTWRLRSPGIPYQAWFSPDQKRLLSNYGYDFPGPWVGQIWDLEEGMVLAMVPDLGFGSLETVSWDLLPSVSPNEVDGEEKEEEEQEKEEKEDAKNYKLEYLSFTIGYFGGQISRFDLVPVKGFVAVPREKTSQLPPPPPTFLSDPELVASEEEEKEDGDDADPTNKHVTDSENPIEEQEAVDSDMENDERDGSGAETRDEKKQEFMTNIEKVNVRDNEEEKNRSQVQSANLAHLDTDDVDQEEEEPSVMEEDGWYYTLDDDVEEIEGDDEEVQSDDRDEEEGTSEEDEGGEEEDGFETEEEIDETILVEEFQDDPYEAVLRWTTVPGKFMAHGTLIEGVQGLSQSNARLLQQNGAQGQPAPSKIVLPKTVPPQEFENDGQEGYADEFGRVLNESESNRESNGHDR